ncbi:glycosyltransferase [Oryzomonas sagensis]|uniref:Glycosyltransferase n=1 Tax=Oryzomonas sagensis TaxID=2603857 RepID=A0ABQ6TKC1_9BACT|nr:glycosyltransferase [Oryzomonas sagensis]KAB0668534.1 glycosyltransferase [Oryzomonas sagensis]
MRIVHVIDSGGLYGAEIMLLNLMSEQVAMGFEPVLASMGERAVADKPLEEEARRRGLRVQVFRMRSGPNVVGALEVLRFARREKATLLHSHGYKGNILLGLIPRSIRKIPMIATIHGWTGTGEINRMMLYEWFDSLALNFIDRIVLVNEAMKSHPKLRNRPRLRMEVVTNGIPLASDPVDLVDGKGLDREVRDFCRGGYTLGAIGRFSREKGFDRLIEAVAILAQRRQDIRLVILGDGDLRKDLERKVRELGLENRVLMPGYRENARDYLPFFRVFVLSSLTEGLPLVLLEAMQAGVPVVATSVGGVPEVLQHGKAGILVPAPRAVDLSEGIGRVMVDEALAAEMADRCKKIVVGTYSARAMAENYAKIYRRLVD